MRSHGLVHPSLMERIQPNFYPSLCTIQEPNESKSSTGQDISNPSDISGLTNLPCRIAPRSTREVQNENQKYVLATHHVALAGYYPSIDEDMFAVVDGTTYGIEGVEHDGNQKTTRLYVRLVESG